LDILEGDGYFYVAREVLVHGDDVGLVNDQLLRTGAVRQPSGPLGDLIAVYQLSELSPAVPELVNQLRGGGPAAARRRPTAPRVGPNIVVQGAFEADPVYHAGPGGAPEPAPEPDLNRIVIEADSVHVAVLDTGVDPAALRLPLLSNRFDASAQEADPVYLGGDQIALTGGHGTMAAGVIAQHAPNAVLHSYRVLNQQGLGTDLDIATTMVEAWQDGVTVMNLSLGGYAAQGQPPIAMNAVLGVLPEEILVVAAAGNHGRSDPYYPAAHPRVVGVAAVDTNLPGEPRADFSNFGPWVDAHSAGVWIHSTYVTGTWDHFEHHKVFTTGYCAWSGTSFAAPHVAGLIASMVHDGLSPSVLAGKLIAAGIPVPDLGVRLIPDGVLSRPVPEKPVAQLAP
jgi:subtilisin family serine protease